MVDLWASNLFWCLANISRKEFGDQHGFRLVEVAVKRWSDGKLHDSIWRKRLRMKLDVDGNLS